MSVSFHALWMLCVLGGVVFAAAAAHDGRRTAALGCGFVAGVFVAWRTGPPDPVRTGALAAGAVAVLLFTPRYALVSIAFGGAMGGIWTALLQAQAVPAVIAVGTGASLLGASVWLARTRRAFAPAILVDEGLLVVGALALAVSTLPSMLDGWQAAMALAATSSRDSTVAIPTWTLAFIVTCTSLGGLYSLWSRR